MTEVRIARESDASAIEEFIEKYWKSGHVFTRSRKLLFWQHLKKNTDQLNFFVAENLAATSIEAINGFIPLSQFDPELEAERDFWLAIWKKRDDSADPMSGIRLYYSFLENLKPVTIGIIGLTEIATQIYRRLGFQIGILDHFFLHNPKLMNPTILKDFGFSFPTPHEKSLFALKEIRGEELESFARTISLESVRPIKSATYLTERYQKHPVYSYRFMGVFLGEKLLNIYVIKKVTVGNAICFRIVDIFGPLKESRSIQTLWTEFLQQEGAEYIDCYQYGISKEVFADLGFLERNEKIIVPNYFEPFEQKNVDVRFAIKAKGPYQIFKGDGDQDRPNLLNADGGRIDL